MLQTVLTGVKTIEYRQVDIPQPKQGEVLLKIMRVGICGSDIHAYYGKHPSVFTPITQGHEFSAVVEALGPGVQGLAVGQPVTVRPQLQCGECYYCKNGRPNVCKKLKVIGCGVEGGCQEYLCVPHQLVYPLPEAMSFEQGAMVEPLAVGIANVRALGDVRGKDILILGAGTIGNLTAQAARALGAGKVAVTDLEDPKLSIAKQCGIDCVISARGQELADEVTRCFGENGPDAVMECVGCEPCVNQAIAVSRKGGKIIIVGVYSEPPRVNMLDVQEKELNLTGVLMYLDEDYKTAIRLISGGDIKLEPLETKHFPLEKMLEAYAYIEENRATSMKVFLDV